MNIQIKVNPDQALPNIAKVEAALGKVEAAGPRAGAAASRGMRETSSAAQAAASQVDKVGGAVSKWSATVGKSLAMGGSMEFARLGFASIGTQLEKITGIKIGGTGTALGFMFGGPMGAALGALGEGLVGLSDKLQVVNQRAAAGLARVGSPGRKAPGAGLFSTSIDPADRAYAIGNELEATRWKGESLSKGSQAELENSRKQRDLKIELASVTDNLGRAVVEQQIATLHAQDAEEDLAKAMDRGVIPREKSTEKIKEQTKALRDLSDVTKLLGQAGGGRRPGLIQTESEAFAAYQQRDAEMRAQQERDDMDHGVPGRNFRGANPDDVGVKLSGSIGAVYGEAAANTTLWAKAMGDVRDTVGEIEGTLKSIGTSIGDTLVDAANGADIAWGDFFKDLGVQIQKAIVNAMILRAIGSVGGGAAGAGTGLLGAMFGGANGFDAMVPGGRGPFLPGFAYGGDMMVGGSGGTDSKIAAFRVTPGESIHVRTPQQREQAQGPSGGGGAQSGTTVIQNVFDRRALLPAINTAEGKRSIMNVIRENPGAVRALIQK